MTAKDLLYKILDYNYLWSSPARKNSKPAKIRLSQIEILLEAFGLTKKYVNPLVQIKYSITGNKEKLNRAQQLNNLTNLEYVLHGEFLYDREKDANKELSDKVLLKMATLYSHLVEHINARPVDIGWLFNDLLNFRQEFYKITIANDGMLEGFSSGLYYSFYLKGQIKEAIKDNLLEIDETLWQILDPYKRDLSEEEINYPKINLDSIDLEWQVENY
ncbi:hypothetical protein [Flavobacterium sp. JAS]|uniref:hypothetical protein n=1 Tax=Flavobacterium sp. JAS TaxID=2897329 RepID=UPI001E33627F|nr:hypothetical protein [Flavobacterium sp. JAS]MCD0469767.1 hypothetical protein [Flavobacterium sp. JAS]